MFNLDETFPLIENPVTKPPFEYSNIGWGEFAVGIHIYFKARTGKKEVLKIDHMLDFENGSKKLYRV